MPEPDRPVVVADCREADCDLATVEALARLALDALRLGCALRIEGASDDLQGLIELLGLEDVLVVPGDGTGPTSHLV